MRPCLKILAVLFSISVASVFLYVVGKRDSAPLNKELSDVAKVEDAQQQHLAKYEQELHLLNSSKRLDPAIAVRIEELKALIKEINENKFAPSKSETTHLFSSSKSGVVLLSGSKTGNYDLESTSEVWELLVPNKDQELILEKNKPQNSDQGVNQSEVENYRKRLLEDEGPSELAKETQGFVRMFGNKAKQLEEKEKASRRSIPHSSKSFSPRSAPQLSDIELLRKLFLNNKTEDQSK